SHICVRPLLGGGFCQEWIQHWWCGLYPVWAAVPRADQRVLSAHLVVGLSCRVGCSILS
ncbi:unnamed protein product, partial [Staurois parvus]